MTTDTVTRPGRRHMPTIVIRDLDPDTVTRLKTQAAAHGRSMQAEAKAIIEAGVPMSGSEWLAIADRLRARTKRGGPSVVELIHEARDEQDEKNLRATSGGRDAKDD
jgi:plasmid stability protein